MAQRLKISRTALYVAIYRGPFSLLLASNRGHRAAADPDERSREKASHTHNRYGIWWRNLISAALRESAPRGAGATYLGQIVGYSFAPASPTPEPSPLALCGMAGAALLLWRARRHPLRRRSA